MPMLAPYRSTIENAYRRHTPYQRTSQCRWPPIIAATYYADPIFYYRTHFWLPLAHFAAGPHQ